MFYLPNCSKNLFIFVYRDLNVFRSVYSEQKNLRKHENKIEKIKRNVGQEFSPWPYTSSFFSSSYSHKVPTNEVLKSKHNLISKRNRPFVLHEMRGEGTIRITIV